MWRDIPLDFQAWMCYSAYMIKDKGVAVWMDTQGMNVSGTVGVGMRQCPRNGQPQIILGETITRPKAGIKPCQTPVPLLC